MIQQMLIGGGSENILVNGSFTSGIGWTLGSGWSISGGKAHCAGAGSLKQTVNRIGGNFRVTYTLSNFTGPGVYVSLDEYNGIVRTASGTYTEIINVASGFVAVFVNPATGTERFDLDNISVVRVG